jgi:poly(A) polymerase/tRNA nucleotidyltransferase (CCA-adding enzyme)
VTKPSFLSDAALGRIWDALPEARVVGGAVRDALVERPVRDALVERKVADIDLATPRPPDEVTAALHAAGVRVVPTGLAHGTVTAVADGRGFEVTTLRRDVETDGRHAVVAFTSDWRLDASRRDFTINAMSMTRDGSVFDYFEGVNDLKAGRVRFVGDPATRIAEDYLRILRFFRFYARYGRVLPDQPTLDALQAGVPGLVRLSVERVWTELRRILGAPDPDEAVGLMVRLGVWAVVLPEAPAVAQLAGLPADPVLRLAAMLTEDPLAAAARLKLSNEDRDRLVRLLATPSPKGSDADLRRLLADHRPQDLMDRALLDGALLDGALLDGALLDGALPDGATDVRRRLAEMERPVFPLEGRDIVATGVAAGPLVGACLRALRQWWISGGCVADRAACLAQLARSTDVSNMLTKR